MWAYTGNLAMSAGGMSAADSQVAEIAWLMGHQAAHALCQHAQEWAVLEEVVLRTANSLLAFAFGLSEPAFIGSRIGADGLPSWGLRSLHECAVILLGRQALRVAGKALWVLYWRHCEAEADGVGFHIAQAACYDPRDSGFTLWALHCQEEQDLNQRGSDQLMKA